ncbi:MAG: gliding motility-associated ABC transporter ATP-binding subunit GldA [Bacteroidales bacterium]|jgi:ABC-2 type transport system ATP-binding protein
MSVVIDNITKIFGTQKAVDSVSINIDKGEVVGFLGSNGAGKSTLMKIICCYLTPNTGTVKVCGYDIFENPIEVKRKIGYLQESNPLYVDMYIPEYLSFIADIYKVSNKKKKIEEIIELTGLIPERRKKIGQLSKGYRQRVGLAQALIHDPEVLILDEPTTGLDPNQLTEIRSLIKKLGEDKTIILSTHIMQEVEAICDRVIIINKGKIITNDTTENIMAIHDNLILQIELKKPCVSNPYKTFPLKHHTNIIEETDDSITLELIFNTKEDIRDKVFNYSKQNNYEILSMSKKQSKLEDVFISLTNK